MSAIAEKKKLKTKYECGLSVPQPKKKLKKYECGLSVPQPKKKHRHARRAGVIFFGE